MEGSEIDLDQTSGGTSTATDRPAIENHSPSGNEVLIMDNDRTTSFFAQPGILAGKPKLFFIRAACLNIDHHIAVQHIRNNIWTFFLLSSRAAVIGGAVVGLLCAILVVMFIVYRMRKKDEGSYALDEPKRSPAGNSYAKNTTNREFYA